MKKLYVVDVYSFFFRAFYAIPGLTSPSGMPTNALYGFLSMTIKLLREIKPDYMAFCFDRKDGSFRVDLYEEYKANRTEMPDDLKPQVPYLKDLTKLLGIPSFEKKGYEADDLIGSLARQGVENGLEVVIVSGDKDFAQLINSKISMMDTMKNITYDEKGAVEKWGVLPEQMIDYLAIVGDSSDNVPGVRGIGPKGAQKLLGEYKTLEGIYENIENISAKGTKTKLQEHQEMAYLSKELVTIVTDLDLVEKMDELKLKEIDRDKLHAMLTELGFKSFERTLLGTGDESGDVKTSVKKSKSIGRKKEAAAPVASGAIDTSDISEKSMDLEKLKKTVKPFSEIWGLLDNRGFVLGYGDSVLKLEGVEPHEIGQALKDKVLQWKGFDVKEVWKHLGIRDQHCAWDAMLAGYVVRAGNINDFGKLCEQYLGRGLPELPSWPQIYSLHRELEEGLKDQLGQVHGEEIFEKFELPTVPVLTEMELQGITLDTGELKAQSEELESDLAHLTSKIYELAGEEFNVASPKQLSVVLFEKLGLTPGKKTKTGFSTNNDVLEKIKEEHEIVPAVMEYRELAKLKSTYVDALPELIDSETHKIHTHFRQAATSTGRLSSTNPNLQNIPIRTERGRLVRKAFKSDEGKVFISVDYSQIELRVLAHITEDKGLIKAFNEDLDIHAATASEIFGVDIEDVTSDLRRTAKAVNFGIAYGQGVYGLAETLGISRGESKEIIDNYFTKFANVKKYMDDIVETAKKNGYVETLFGRRRYLDELKSKNHAMKAFGERAAINAPIQGTASDLVKLAMIRLFEEVSIPAVLQVHDEVLFECPVELVDDNVALIQEIMENVTELKVPLKVNVAVGTTWDDAH